jgi:hypothetical protein
MVEKLKNALTSFADAIGEKSVVMHVLRNDAKMYQSRASA